MRRALRELVWQRAHACCEYCLLPAEFDDTGFEIDHIVAEKHDGRTEPENLVLACFPCNNHKGPNIVGLDLVSRAAITLFHPRLEKSRSFSLRWAAACRIDADRPRDGGRARD